MTPIQTTDAILGRLSLPGALRSWGLIGLLAVVCIGVIVFAWPSSDGRAVKPTTPSSAGAARADPGVQQPLVQAQTTARGAGPTSGPIAPEGQTIARELANLEQGIEQLKTSQAQLARDNAGLADSLKATQEQMARHDAKLAEDLKAAQDEMVRNNLSTAEQLKANQDQIVSIGEQLKARLDRLGAPKQPPRPPKLASPSSPQPNAAPTPKPTVKPAPKPQSPQAGLPPKSSTQSLSEQQ
jgi:hypothetical protein